MRFEDMPKWAQNDIGFYDSSIIDQFDDWQDNSDPKKASQSFSRVVKIVYPSAVHFVIDKLDPENGWVEQDGMYFTKGLAEATAHKKAYYSDRPHRIRMVVWNG